MNRRILRNSIICPDGTELVSRHSWDFQCYYDDSNRCFAVDGGSGYLKRIGVGYTETSIIDDGLFTTQRSVCEWGQNYDKNSKKLKQTKWVKIKDLDTEHIYRILETQVLDKFWVKLFYDEIKFREELILNENREL